MTAIHIETSPMPRAKRAPIGHIVSEFVEFLRYAKAALRMPHRDLRDLADKDLHDIGARQTDIGRLVDRDKNWILQASLTRARSRVID